MTGRLKGSDSSTLARRMPSSTAALTSSSWAEASPTAPNRSKRPKSTGNPDGPLTSKEFSNKLETIVYRFKKDLSLSIFFYI